MKALTYLIDVHPVFNGIFYPRGFWTPNHRAPITLELIRENPDIWCIRDINLTLNKYELDFEHLGIPSSREEGDYDKVGFDTPSEALDFWIVYRSDIAEKYTIVREYVKEGNYWKLYRGGIEDISGRLDYVNPPYMNVP